MAHIEMSLLSIECFMNDGKLDSSELDKMVSLAEQDGKITQEEVTAVATLGTVGPGESYTTPMSRHFCDPMVYFFC